MAEPQPTLNTWNHADEQQALLRAWKLVFRAYQTYSMVALKDDALDLRVFHQPCTQARKITRTRIKGDLPVQDEPIIVQVVGVVPVATKSTPVALEPAPTLVKLSPATKVWMRYFFPTTSTPDVCGA